MRDRAAAPEIIPALSDPEPFVRKEAAWALGALPDRQATLPLGRALGDTSAEVRLEAACSLERIGNRRAVPTLTRLLRDSRRTVRWQAARALAEVASPFALDELIGAVADSAAEVRVEVVRALGMVGRQRALEPLMERVHEDQDSEVRSLAALVLGDLRNAWAVPTLIDALHDRSGRVRWAAATSLGLIADGRAREPLERLLKTETHEPVKLAVRLSLYRIGTIGPPAE
jgi:HEAT repeat protein